MSLMVVFQVLRRRLWIVGWSLLSTLAGAFLVLALVPARYDATTTATIDPSISDPVSGQISSPQSIMILQGNLMAMAKSNQVALAVVKRLNMDADPASQDAYQRSSDSGLIDIRQWLVNKLIDNVDAKFALGSNVLTLTYKANSPQQAAALANAFMSSFIDAAIAFKVTAASKAAAWFAPQIDKIRADLLRSRGELAQFQTESKLLSPSSGDSENDQLMAVTGELTKAKTELVAMQAQLNAPALTAATSNDAQSIDLQTLAALRSNLSNIDADIAKTQLETGANNPKLLEKLALRSSLQKQMQAAIDDYRKKLSDRIATQKERVGELQKAYAERLNNMVNIQGQREQLVSLTREVSFHQDELERALRAASQARLQSQMSFSNIVVVDVATPPTSVAFPKPIIVIPLSIGLGLGLGTLLALLAEALNRLVRSPNDLPLVTNAPLLGIMPSIRPTRPSTWSRLTARIPLPGLRRPRPNKASALLGS